MLQVDGVGEAYYRRSYIDCMIVLERLVDCELIMVSALVIGPDTEPFKTAKNCRKSLEKLHVVHLNTVHKTTQYRSQVTIG